MPSGNFLSAHWEYLAMFNYTVDKEMLLPYLPPFTELDLFEGKALVSVVGFMFNNTRVMGIKWPGFVNFEEVNLRYYIKYFDGKKWKRGVGFVSEIVPSRLIATIANTCYNEHYDVAKMNHSIGIINDVLTVKYQWKCTQQEWNEMTVIANNTTADIIKGSEEEFIFEHYFGYNKLNNQTTIEYSLEHPRWQIYKVSDFTLNCNIEKLYGADFAPYIQNVQPSSVFLARGSEVKVKMPKKLYR